MRAAVFFFFFQLNVETWIFLLGDLLGIFLGKLWDVDKHVLKLWDVMDKNNGCSECIFESLVKKEKQKQKTYSIWEFEHPALGFRGA